MAEWTKEIDAEMARAVKWLADHGGSGTQVRYGQVLAGGEVSSDIQPLTWLRCLFAGKLELHHGRIWTLLAVAKVRQRLHEDEMTQGSL